MTTEMQMREGAQRGSSREIDWGGEPRRKRQIRRLRALAEALDQRWREALRIAAELDGGELYLRLHETIDRRIKRLHQIRMLLLELER